jgi:hypothetical protein
MQRTSRMDYRTIANAKVNNRIKEVVVLVLTIIMGILISVSVNY